MLHICAYIYICTVFNRSTYILPSFCQHRLVDKLQHCREKWFWIKSPPCVGAQRGAGCSWAITGGHWGSQCCPGYMAAAQSFSWEKLSWCRGVSFYQAVNLEQRYEVMILDLDDGIFFFFFLLLCIVGIFLFVC